MEEIICDINREYDILNAPFSKCAFNSFRSNPSKKDKKNLIIFCILVSTWISMRMRRTMTCR
jgi:hypothetical protein